MSPWAFHFHWSLHRGVLVYNTTTGWAWFVVVLAVAVTVMAVAGLFGRGR